MTELDFTPAELAVIRAWLGFRDGDRELTAADLLVALEAREVVGKAARRITAEQEES